MPRLNYADAYETIAKRGDSETLARFADRWSRWPTGLDALEIVQELKARMDSYFKLDCTREGEAIADVIEEIIRRAEESNA